MPSPLKVVMVGCGGMANAWVRSFQPMKQIELVGLVDLNLASAQSLAAKHNYPQEIVFPSLKDAIKAAQPEAVFDVTVPPAHYSVTMEALKAGLHVLGEKPMSDSLASAKKMVAAAQKSGKVYAVIQNRRYNPRLRQFIKVLHSNKLGAIEEIHADFFLGPHFGGFRDEMPFPLVIDMAIHTIDAGRYIANADPVSVYCHSFNPRRSWYKGDCSAVIIFEMTGGIVFTYRGSWCAQGLKTSWEAQWRVVCNKGTATWDGGDKLEAELAKPTKDATNPQKSAFFWDTTPVPFPEVKLEHTGHAGLIHDFYKAIRGGKPPITSCEDNIKSLAMVLAAVESAKSGKRVKVQWT